MDFYIFHLLIHLLKNGFPGHGFFVFYHGIDCFSTQKSAAEKSGKEDNFDMFMHDWLDELNRIDQQFELGERQLKKQMKESDGEWKTKDCGIV